MKVFLKINGRLHYLWRAVDQDGDVLDIMVQSKRDKKAAKKFFRKLLKRLRHVPRAIITDKLKSYSCPSRKFNLTYNGFVWINVTVPCPEAISLPVDLDRQGM